MKVIIAIFLQARIVLVMSIIAIHLDQNHVGSSPACAECGGLTRLTGLEPHPTKARTDLRTYECMACEAVQAIVAPVT